MASRKGIIITAIILAGITATSFLAWLPDTGTNEATFVIKDHKKYLDDVKNISEVLDESVAIEFERMLSSDITPAEYMRGTETVSVQITSIISEFITSKPPKEWQESYIMYGEALKAFNSYVAETEALAGIMESNNEITTKQMQASLERIDVLKSTYENHKILSDMARPPP